MNNVRKLVATVLVAAVLVIIGVSPSSASAKTNPFVDLPRSHTHYDSIVTLYHLGIVEGTSSNRFSPNQDATRQEAALYLANALGLNTVNVPDPGFRDVPKSSKYHGAIAALYHAGIINGYPDGTFKPTATLKRSQIAKMITLGFDLKVSNRTTTPFKDVNVIKDMATKQYIQTLVDYKITTGTTPTTFSPYMSLKRGQLATFLNRSISNFQVIGVE